MPHYPGPRPSRSPFAIVIACFVALLGTQAVANPQVGIYVEKYFLENAQGQTQKISVSGSSTGAENVDVHVGLIAPDGTIYEFPNWNTTFQPWLENLALPANFLFPASFVFDAAQFPGGVTPGIWYAAAALTEPGTLRFIDVELVPFHVVDATAGADGTVYGALGFNRQQTISGAEVSADGVFIDVSGELEELVAAYVGTTPDINQCVLNQTAVDLSVIPNLTVDTLDAGNPLTLASPAATLNLPKDADAASSGFNVYTAVNPSPTFYQGGVNYTFAGTGGSDLGAFSVAVAAPAPLNLTQPSLGLGSYAHNASQPLTLQWTGGSGVGEVSANLSATTGSTVVVIDCRFADDGEGVIPAGLITQMKNILESDSGGLGIPGFELPDGIELPGLGSQAFLNVSRVVSGVFNTAGNELDVGLATISSGADLSVTLQ
jgi:hypothetical protein